MLNDELQGEIKGRVRLRPTKTRDRSSPVILAEGESIRSVGSGRSPTCPPPPPACGRPPTPPPPPPPPAQLLGASKAVKVVKKSSLRGDKGRPANRDDLLAGIKGGVQLKRVDQPNDRSSPILDRNTSGGAPVKVGPTSVIQPTGLLNDLQRNSKFKNRSPNGERGDKTGESAPSYKGEPAVVFMERELSPPRRQAPPPPPPSPPNLAYFVKTPRQQDVKLAVVRTERELSPPRRPAPPPPPPSPPKLADLLTFSRQQGAVKRADTPKRRSPSPSSLFPLSQVPKWETKTESHESQRPLKLYGRTRSPSPAKLTSAIQAWETETHSSGDQHQRQTTVKQVQRSPSKDISSPTSLFPVLSSSPTPFRKLEQSRFHSFSAASEATPANEAQRRRRSSPTKGKAHQGTVVPRSPSPAFLAACQETESPQVLPNVSDKVKTFEYPLKNRPIDRPDVDELEQYQTDERLLPDVRNLAATFETRTDGDDRTQTQRRRFAYGSSETVLREYEAVICRGGSATMLGNRSAPWIVKKEPLGQSSFVAEHRVTPKLEQLQLKRMRDMGAPKTNTAISTSSTTTASTGTSNNAGATALDEAANSAPHALRENYKFNIDLSSNDVVSMLRR